MVQTSGAVDNPSDSCRSPSEVSPQADEEIYPDEGTVAEDPLFKVEKDPVAIEGAPAEDIKPSKDETKSQSEPGFEFVKD